MLHSFSDSRPPTEYLVPQQSLVSCYLRCELVSNKYAFQIWVNKENTGIGLVPALIDTQSLGIGMDKVINALLIKSAILSQCGCQL